MKEVWENELGLCKITGLSCFSMFGLEGKPRNYFSQSQLEVSYADKKYDYYENGVKRRYSFIKEWIFYEDKKIYDAIDSFPIKDECPDNILNVWVDFPVVSYLEKMGGDFVYDEDAVKTYRQHIYLMAGEEQESCDFLEKWIGNFFQYPASKSLCPVIIGEQGTGKDLLVDIISAIIGNDRRLTTSKPEDDVWGKFNEIMENKILVHLSEVNSFQTSAGMNTLKDYITNPNFVIKRKGLKSSTIKSHHKYIALSNNAMPIKCGEGQRRFVNLLSSSKMKGNNEYFDKLVEIMGDMNKLASIYKYFMGLQNIPVRLTEKDIVKSEFHQEMESIVVDEVKEFIMDYINENKNEVCDKVRIADLYPQYKTFCEKKYYNNVKSLMSFSAKFGILMRSQLFSKITKNNKDRIGFSFNIPTREMALDFGYFGEVGGSN
jgi:ribosomal protein S24E